MRGSERRASERAARARAQEEEGGEGLTPPTRPLFASFPRARARRLPKTRSGKIMRRILRKLIAREYESIGDTSTLADPSVVEELKAKVDKLLGPRAPV